MVENSFSPSTARWSLTAFSTLCACEEAPSIFSQRPTAPCNQRVASRARSVGDVGLPALHSWDTSEQVLAPSWSATRFNPLKHRASTLAPCQDVFSDVDANS